jgi:uncharacterized membrane protein YtjA (UPF0391 family)
MLRFAMLSLVCSVSAGVFGFGDGASSSMIWAKCLFFVFLVLSVVGFVSGTMGRPSGILNEENEYVTARNTHWQEIIMLWTIFVILMILWLLGMVTSTTLGGFIHILLIIAIAVVLIRVIQGRNPI